MNNEVKRERGSIKRWAIPFGLLFITGTLMMVYWRGELGQWVAGYTMGASGGVLMLRVLLHKYLHFTEKPPTPAEKEK